MAYPEWLPDILQLNRDLETLIADLFSIYQRYISTSNPMLHGRRVRCIQFKELFCNGSYDKTFLHLITRKDYSIQPEGRLYDPRRCERLNWVRPLIENADDPGVITWRRRHDNGKVRLYLWLEECDYVVILQEDNWDIKGVRQPVYVIITCYHISNERNRKDMLSSYEDRLIED